MIHAGGNVAAKCPRCSKNHWVEEWVSDLGYPVLCVSCRRERFAAELRITDVRRMLAGMTGHQRMEFVCEILDGYCDECGWELEGHSHHHCDNDE